MRRIIIVLFLLDSLVCAELTDNELRKEFEDYRAETELRIEKLEQSSRGEGSAESDILSDRSTRDFEFHGYFRAGLGVNGDGDAMEAFKAPNAGAKYRLGNEAEAYIEATYKQNYRTDELIENGVDIFSVLTLAYFTPTVDNNAFETTTSLREAYAGARGVWDANKEALFWAGNRFYEHLDIHINDFFYRDMSGFGGGVEDIAIGDDIKWAVAWLGGSIDELNSSGTAFTNDYHFNKNTLDFRLYDMPLCIGKLQLSLDFAHFSGDTLDIGTASDVIVDDSDGWAVGAILQSDLNENIVNKFTAQYGEGAADNFRSVITAPMGVTLADGLVINTDDTQRLRITDDIVINQGAPLSLQAVILYERYNNGQNAMETFDWVSAGARPVYHFNSYFSLAFEAGADYTKQKDGLEGVLGKFTLAPQIQPSAQHFSRPSIRAYITYAVWSDQFEGSVANINHGMDTAGLSFGVQMESWW